MTTVTGTSVRTSPDISKLIGGACENQAVTIHGAVHSLRDMGGVTFLTLRTPGGAVQCVCAPGAGLEGAREECAASVTGVVRREARAPGGFELQGVEIKILSSPAAPLPSPVNRRALGLRLDKELALRPVALRNLRARSVFKLQEGVCRAFRDFLFSQGFTEIHTPKLVRAGAEGGSNLFRLDYFGRKAFLAQSPQFYKQMLVGVYERVFEIAPVFRAEKHATPRHLNEYTSLDLEMGYIAGFYDMMELEAGFLRHLFQLLRAEYADDLKRLDVALPELAELPVLRFDEAKRLAAERYGRPIRDPYDLEPEEEANIGRYAREEWGSDFVFVTHYPGKKRPFYAMDDPDDPRYTLSFDLLYKGMEITTGGQRIHDHRAQVEKMERLGMHPAEFESYLMLHKYGAPPHGGLGVGLERLTMKLCGLENIRYASLFPRDMGRLEP